MEYKYSRSVGFHYFEQNDVFADLFNFVLRHNGIRQEIDPGEIQSLSRSNGNAHVVTKGKSGLGAVPEPDNIVKLWRRKNGAMAVLILVTDLEERCGGSILPWASITGVIPYYRQMREKPDPDWDKETCMFRFCWGEELKEQYTFQPCLRGLPREENRLIPSVIAFLNLGEKPWDGPATLGGMLDGADGDFPGMIPDFRLNIIEPAGMEEEEFPLFRSKLKYIFWLLKHRNDAPALMKFFRVQEHRDMVISYDAAGVLRSHGLPFGAPIGPDDFPFLTPGSAEMLRMVEEETARSMHMEFLRSLMESMGIALQEAMDLLKIPDEERGLYEELIRAVETDLPGDIPSEDNAGEAD